MKMYGKSTDLVDAVQLTIGFFRVPEGWPGWFKELQVLVSVTNPKWIKPICIKQDVNSSILFANYDDCLVKTSKGILYNISKSNFDKFYLEVEVPEKLGVIQ